MGAVTFIARMTVKEGRDQEFISLMRELGDYVEAKEPGTEVYQLYRLREPNRYAALESFRDEAAAKVHAESAKLAELAPKISDCLIGSWELEYLDPID